MHRFDRRVRTLESTLTLIYKNCLCGNVLGVTSGSEYKYRLFSSLSHLILAIKYISLITCLSY